MPMEYRMLDQSKTITGLFIEASEGRNMDCNKFVKMLDKEIKADPKDPRLYVKKSLALQQDRKKALAAVDEGLRNAGENSMLYHARAIVFELTDERDKAIKAFQDAIRVDPVAFESVMSLATLLNRSGKFKEAIEYWDLIIQLEPDSPIGWFGKSKSEYHSGDGVNALKHINSALFFFENGSERLDICSLFMGPFEQAKAGYLRSRAVMLAEMDRVGEAIKDCEEAFRLGDESALDDLSRFGKSAMEKGKEDDLLKYMEKYIELDPTGGEQAIFYKVLGTLYANAGEKEKVTELFKKGIEVTGREKEMLDIQTQTLAGAGMLEEAIKVCDRLCAIDSFPGFALNGMQFCRAVKEHKGKDMTEKAKEFAEKIGGMNNLLAVMGSQPQFVQNPDIAKELIAYYVELTGDTGNVKVVKVKRNGPCPCGSGKKFKKCCGR